MSTSTAPASRSISGISLEGLFVEETLAKDVMISEKKAVKKTTVFTSADLWNCRRRGRKARRSFRREL